MKRFAFTTASIFLCASSFASTWECIDSADGHKYRATQDVAADVCTKIDDIDHSLDNLSPELREQVRNTFKPKSKQAQIGSPD